jgi:alcohol dehydrogenase
MKAWQIDRLGGQLHLNNIEVPEVRSGSVLVRVEAQSLRSYLKDYIEGKLAAYRPVAKYQAFSCWRKSTGNFVWR